MKKRAVTFSFSLVLLAACLLTGTLFSRSEAATRSQIQRYKVNSRDGLIYFKRKDYAKAINCFQNALKIQPGDAPLHYYLGMAAFNMKDYDLASQELSKVVVMEKPGSRFYKNAIQCFSNCKKEFNNLKPYNCAGTTGKYFRWSKKDEPVKIFISHGLKLPKGYREKKLNETQLHNLSGWLKDKKFVSKIRRDSHYDDSFWEAAKKGIAEWSFAKSENLIDFKLVKDPYDAQILVFWCSQAPSKTSAFTNIPVKEGDRAIIQISVEYILGLQAHYRGDTVRYIAAHEFGHALGLLDSPFERDIMYPIEKTKVHKTGFHPGGSNKVNQNDEATLKALYQLPVLGLKKK